ncbi:glycosyltransferase [Draconibacterium sp. IB214405]|uniref:glycosyltransferase n=1 Tax=Draconibacterium sp. IB214405 TaxID=3097352 RepID=UPI002A1815E7|nr:glycosyltransferase [Draconibacterium sp. IB214405]MDX8338077.1 glycosyltransferase [Draconibacterium sp. IB214405]
MEDDIADGTWIIKLPIWEPYGLFKKLTGRRKEEKVNTGLLFDEKKQSFAEKASLWLRGNLLIPDPRVFWVRPSAKRLAKICKEIEPDAIVTTGPPHSVHLIGLKLKKQFPEIKWISDFRDPWADIDYLDTFYASGFARKVQARLEKKVMDNSNTVLTVSPTWAKELQAKTNTPVTFITNGFDHDDFAGDFSSKPTQDFILSHIGIITSYRNPLALWQAIEELCVENKNFREKLKVQIIGTFDAGLKRSLESFPNVKDKTVATGYLPHNQVIKKYEESSCLLLLLNNSKNAQGHIPGKFFEYIASGKPVLAMAPENSDVAGIIQENKIGFACDFEDKDKVKKAILDIFIDKVKATETKTAEQYSRKNLTAKLTELLGK